MTGDSPSRTARVVKALLHEFPEKAAHLPPLVDLLDAGIPVPFLACYRKDRTGGMDEATLRTIQGRRRELVLLEKRREGILRGLEGDGAEGDSLRQKAESALTLADLDELVAGTKPVEMPKEVASLEMRLGPLATAIEKGETGLSPKELAEPFVSAESGSPDVETALKGAQEVLAARMGAHPGARARLKNMFLSAGRLISKLVPDGDAVKKYETYHSFTQGVRTVPSHRVLAIMRGAREKALQVSVEIDRDSAITMLKAVLLPGEEHPHRERLSNALELAYEGLLRPAAEKEALAVVKGAADREAVKTFGRNFEQLLMQPPAGGVVVMGVLPGVRSGCKIAVVNEKGEYLSHASIFPFPPKEKKGARKKPKATPKPVEEPPVEKTVAVAPPVAEPPVVAPPVEEPPVVEPPVVAPPVVEPPVEEPPVVEPPVVAPPVVEPPVEESPVVEPPVVAPPVVEPAVVEPPAAKPPKPEAPKKPDGSRKTEAAKRTVANFCRQHKVAVIGLGGGPGSREVERFLRDVLRQDDGLDVQITTVNDAGVSTYAKGKAGKAEFPKLDSRVRAAIAIARRLADPMAELVKVEPRTIGVGPHQRDVDQKLLRQALVESLECCVARVGADLNSAGPELLKHLPGLSLKLARAIVAWRDEKGPFTSRQQLNEVPGMDERAFLLCAGFLRVNGGENPLDRTRIHPEAYAVVEDMAEKLGVEPGDLVESEGALDGLDPLGFTGELAGPSTVHQVFSELRNPAGDPRGAFEPPKFRDDLQALEDLKEGMQLDGVVTNVAAFGAFVDVGIDQEGLVHVSELSDGFVEDAGSVVSVGKRVSVRVIGVDMERKRISLSMRTPGAKKPRRQDTSGRPSGGGRRPQRGKSGEGAAARGRGRGRPGDGRKGKGKRKGDGRGRREDRGDSRPGRAPRVIEQKAKREPEPEIDPDLPEEEQFRLKLERLRKKFNTGR